MNFIECITKQWTVCLVHSEFTKGMEWDEKTRVNIVQSLRLWSLTQVVGGWDREVRDSRFKSY